MGEKMHKAVNHSWSIDREEPEMSLERKAKKLVRSGMPFGSGINWDTSRIRGTISN